MIPPRLLDSTLCVRTKTVLAPKKDATQATSRSASLATALGNSTGKLARNLTVFHLTQGQGYDFDGAEILDGSVVRGRFCFSRQSLFRPMNGLETDWRISGDKPSFHRKRTDWHPHWVPLFYDKYRYKTCLYNSRPLIESFFAKLQQCRVLATCYDKKSINLLGASTFTHCFGFQYHLVYLRMGPRLCAPN